MQVYNNSTQINFFEYAKLYLCKIKYKKKGGREMKKLKLIVLTMILSLFLFAGVNVMAMDEDTVKNEEPKTVVSEEAPKGIEGGNTAEEVKAEEKEEIVEEGNKEASAPNEDKATKTDVEKVGMGGGTKL